MKTLFLVIMLLSSVSFANRESGGRGRGTSVYVNFLSFGTGIDSVTSKKLDILIKRAKRSGQVVSGTFEQKGREGEKQVCVDLTDATHRFGMIRELAPLIIADRKKTGHERTIVYVGTDCSDINNATEQNLEAYLRP